MCCANSPNYSPQRVPNSFLYNGWVALCNGDRNDASNHNPLKLDAVRLSSSKQPSKDVLVTDFYSRSSSYSMLDGSAAGQANPIVLSGGSCFPHPSPPNGGQSPASPKAKRVILYVDGHVEAKFAVASEAIDIRNWRWPLQ
jgi:prepilin-type processing-associated H-X9-DG protein